MLKNLKNLNEKFEVKILTNGNILYNIVRSQYFSKYSKFKVVGARSSKDFHFRMSSIIISSITIDKIFQKSTVNIGKIVCTNMFLAF